VSRQDSTPISDVAIIDTPLATQYYADIAAKDNTFQAKYPDGLTQKVLESVFDKDVIFTKNINFPLENEETKESGDNMTRTITREPAMPDSGSYSRETLDAKFETLEQKMLTVETRIDGKLDLVLSKIGDLWKILAGALFALIVGLILLVYQNAHEKPPQPIVIQSAQAPSAYEVDLTHTPSAGNTKKP
jgi:hypothetical protein